MIQRTYMAKEKDVQCKCYLIDAKDKILGRVAAKAAAIIRGKHKPTFTPHVNCGDMVVIINADKIKVTGKKLTDKFYARYSGYIDGLHEVPLGEMLKNKPETLMTLAVNRMISRNPLGWQIRSKLKVYAGDKHPHQAQKPILLEI